MVARAYKDGYYTSDATHADQLVVTPVTLPAPTIYPDGGTFLSEATIYLGTTVLGGQIRYTTDGSIPTALSPLYMDPIAITGNTTVKARLYYNGYTPSATKSIYFSIITEIPTPTFYPASGTNIDDALYVYLGTTVLGADIRYTTNGSEPTVTSPLYINPIILGPGEYTVKARSFLRGLVQSTVVTATYTVFSTASLAPPTITPHGGVFNGPITVTLSSNTEGAFLYYTTNGTDPFTSPDVIAYSGPFQLVGNDTYFVRARAYTLGPFVLSDMASAGALTVVTPTLGTVQTPTISPPGGKFTNTVAVSVQAPDWSSPFNIRKLYTTTDGAAPVADFTSPVDGVSGSYNLNISTPQAVKALSAQQGWLDSTVASAEYTFICETPTITDGDTFIDSANVSINTGTSSATIYYTTDGSEPTTTDSLYASTFSVTASQVVKAMCIRNNFEQSKTAISVFIINETPVAPAILAQPQNQTATTCTGAAFSVTTIGSDPLSYAWYKDGSIIGGATEPELTLAAVIPADAGSYSVHISNSAGDVTSSAATLAVNGTDSSCFNADFPWNLFLPAILNQ